MDLKGAGRGAERELDYSLYLTTTEFLLMLSGLLDRH